MSVEEFCDQEIQTSKFNCLLWWVQWKSLYMTRLIEEKFENWGTPSRELEKDVNNNLYCEFATCTSDMNKCNLEKAYINSWEFGKKLIDVLKVSYNINLPEELIRQINQLLIFKE
jgi:hypothetical protein